MAVFNKAGYAASQQNRYNNAVKSGDSGLATRLQADAKRVGYTLANPAPVIKVGGAGAGVTNTGAGSSTVNATTNVTPDSKYIDMARNESFKVTNPNAGIATGTYVKGGLHLSDDQLTGAAGILQQRADAQKRLQDALNAEIEKGYGITDEFAKSNLAPLYKEVYDAEDRLGSQYGMTGMSDFGYFGGTVSRNNLQAPGIAGSDTAAKVSSPFSYGGNIMGFAPSTGNQSYDAIQKQIADLGQQWQTASPGDRAAIHEKAMNLGQSAGGTFDSRTGKWSFPAPQTATQGYTGAEAQNEIDAQIRAYQAQQEALKSSAMFGVDQNNAYLNEQIGKLRTAKNQNDLQIQETENRFGGVYSGGLRLGQAANLNSTNEAIGGVTRDIAARNQQLTDQYGTQANAIAANIADLQAKAPQIIRDKILEYQMKTSALTGMFNGQPTTEEQQRHLANLWTVAEQTGVIPNQLADLYGIKRGTKTQDAYQFAQEMALRWNDNKLARDKFDWDKQNPGGSSGNNAPTALDSETRTYFDNMVQRDEDGKITNRTALENSILNAPISDRDAYLLYLRYELPWTGPVPIPN